MAETYRKIDNDTLEIISNHTYTVEKQHLEKEKQDAERDKEHAEERIEHIDMKLDILRGG